MRNFIERIVVQAEDRLAFDTKEDVRPSLISKFQVYKHFVFNANLIKGTTYQFS